MRSQFIGALSGLVLFGCATGQLPDGPASKPAEPGPSAEDAARDAIVGETPGEDSRRSEVAPPVDSGEGDSHADSASVAETPDAASVGASESAGDADASETIDGPVIEPPDALDALGPGPDAGEVASDDGGADVAEAPALEDAPTDALDETPEACAPIRHDDGVGASYLDCAPLGVVGDATTYSETMAREAAAAWAPGAAPTAAVCASGASHCLSVSDGVTCARWCFDGPLAGRVWQSKTSRCNCPYPTDPAWD